MKLGDNLGCLDGSGGLQVGATLLHTQIRSDRPACDSDQFARGGLPLVSLLEGSSSKFARGGLPLVSLLLEGS